MSGVRVPIVPSKVRGETDADKQRRNDIVRLTREQQVLEERKRCVHNSSQNLSPDDKNALEYDIRSKTELLRLGVVSVETDHQKFQKKELASKEKELKFLEEKARLEKEIKIAVLKKEMARLEREIEIANLKKTIARNERVK